MDSMYEVTTKFARLTTNAADTGTVSMPKSRARRVSRKSSDSSAASTNTEASGTSFEGSVSSLRAEFLRNRTQTDKSVDKILARLAELEKTEAKLSETEALLEEAKAQCTRQERDLSRALATAKEDAEELLRRQRLRKTTHDLQFRKYTIDSEPGRIKFDLVQTFSVFPKYGKSVMAYMKFDGKPHYSQSGDHPATLDGIISGKDYSGKACELFQILGYEPPRVSWFQHAEPQLMALYVERFRNGSLTFERFRDIHTASGIELLEVEILVSSPPCWHCQELRKKVNVKAENHGFYFTLRDISFE